MTPKFAYPEQKLNKYSSVVPGFEGFTGVDRGKLISGFSSREFILFK
jgi:hypothetical protein